MKNILLVAVKLSNKSVNFKIDIWSDVCVIPDNVYFKHFNIMDWQKAGPKLLAPDQQIIDYLGTFTAYIQYKREVRLKVRYLLLKF